MRNPKKIRINDFGEFIGSYRRFGATAILVIRQKNPSNFNAKDDSLFVWVAFCMNTLY
jgi:hypothetical protein